VKNAQDARLAEAIARAEARYGVVCGARVAARVVGSRSTLRRALARGELQPFGRRGAGEVTFAVAELVTWMAGPAADGCVAAPASPSPSPSRRAAREVDAALARLEQLRSAG
jgi:hypothetical protein